ncbi:hypothetical protein QQ045_006236 [Rhodiola kirilowii]
MTVYIKHSMGKGIIVDVHCKSKDDDLGVRHLPEGQYFRFGFGPHVVKNTLFWCDVSWNGRKQVFNAYKDPESYWDCHGVGCECPWNLTPNGPCFFNVKTQQFDKCGPWRG